MVIEDNIYIFQYSWVGSFSIFEKLEQIDSEKLVVMKFVFGICMFSDVFQSSFYFFVFGCEVGDFICILSRGLFFQFFSIFFVIF